MTTLTIELPPEVYRRLHAEAQRQGKAEQLLVEEILAGQLLSETDTEVPLYISMLPQIRAIAAKVNIDDLVSPGNASPEETIALLRSWSEEEADEDEDAESWEDVLRSIDANRTSYRKLFPDLGSQHESLCPARFRSIGISDRARKETRSNR